MKKTKEQQRAERLEDLGFDILGWVFSRKSKAPFYFSDLSKRFDADLRDVVDVCDNLMRKGFICVDKKSLDK